MVACEDGGAEGWILSATFNSIVSCSLIFTYQNYDSDSSRALLCRWGGLVYLTMDREYCYWPSDWNSIRNGRFSYCCLCLCLMCLMERNPNRMSVREWLVHFIMYECYNMKKKKQKFSKNKSTKNKECIFLGSNSWIIHVLCSAHWQNVTKTMINFNMLTA